MPIANTIYCVHCMKRKATSWRGHVLDGKKTITAGWCDRCAEVAPGFSGQYKKKMKTIKDRTL